MSAVTIIKQAAVDGVTITASPAGRLKLVGDQTAVNRWVPVVREHKPAIVAALQDDPAVAAIKAWLTHIGETDPVMVNECLSRCATDPDALAYFLWRSKEVPATVIDPDKRDALECGQTDCRDCRNYRGTERVCAASRCPTPATLFRRCDSFKPRATP